MPQEPIKVWKIKEHVYGKDNLENRRNYPDGQVMLIQKPTYEETMNGTGRIIEIPCDDEGNPIVADSDAPEPAWLAEPVDVPETEPDEEPEDAEEDELPDMAIPI